MICFWTGERIRPTPLKIDPTRPRSLNRILEQNGRGTMGTYTRALRLFPTRGGHVRLMRTITSVPNCPKQPSPVLTCLIPFPSSLPYAPHHAERLQG
jgi:hypothetical protein